MVQLLIVSVFLFFIFLSKKCLFEYGRRGTRCFYMTAVLMPDRIKRYVIIMEASSWRKMRMQARMLLAID